MPREFIVPGETRASAALEVARATMRRAERRVIALGGSRAHVHGPLARALAQPRGGPAVGAGPRRRAAPSSVPPAPWRRPSTRGPRPGWPACRAPLDYVQTARAGWPLERTPNGAQQRPQPAEPVRPARSRSPDRPAPACARPNTLSGGVQVGGASAIRVKGFLTAAFVWMFVALLRERRLRRRS